MQNFSHFRNRNDGIEQIEILNHGTSQGDAAKKMEQGPLLTQLTGPLGLL